MDPALNNSCRLITGCRKPTKVDFLYTLAGIAPPDIRRKVATQKERTRQLSDNQHLLYGHTLIHQRLKRQCFMVSEPLSPGQSAKTSRTKLWRGNAAQLRSPVTNSLSDLPSAEKLAPGHNQPWLIWRSLNRLRTDFGRAAALMHTWRYKENNLCDCGEAQTMEHMLACRLLLAARRISSVQITLQFKLLPIGQISYDSCNDRLIHMYNNYILYSTFLCK